MSLSQPSVAYFSMEIGIDPRMPTYSGGLGVLAGDTLRAAADLGAPILAVTLLYRNGYFRQHLDPHGQQTESPCVWTPEHYMERMPVEAVVQIEGRPVRLAAWRYDIKGIHGHIVPIYFLDTLHPENGAWEQTLSGPLYGGDQRFRLCQEVVLGLGGVAVLRALGHTDVRVFHMNEGHAALLTVALLEEQMGKKGLAAATDADRAAVRRHCVFTTHTPVPAGHDQFPLDLVGRVIGEERTKSIEARGCCPTGVVNMTSLALSSSRYINGVAMRHGEISQDMFPNYPIDSITNGVHSGTWVAPAFVQLFDQYIPEWRHDNTYLRHAICIPLPEIRQAHLQAKKHLFAVVRERTGVQLDVNHCTIGFARRATAYKRAGLLFSHPDRLRAIVKQAGPLQIIYAGKAHPHDVPGKGLIRSIFEAAATVRDSVRVVYVEEYDMTLAKILCAGVDLWLNTPQKPQEASGTSGMKAALNGVPSLSTLDGWWVEGHIEGVTGWAIGRQWPEPEQPEEEVQSLYEKLEHVILPLYYAQSEAFDRIRQSTIALNGSFFNAQRMVTQYVHNAYFPASEQH